jgi:hypothetical protein
MTNETPKRPTFRDAYWVEIAGGDGTPLGFVRRRGAVWHVFLLALAANEQPRDGFATREEAGQRLIEIVTAQAKHAAR